MPGAAPAIPPTARSMRFGRKRLLLALVVIVVLVSGVIGGRQLWIIVHLPPQLSVKTFEAPFIPLDEAAHFDESNPTLELHQILPGPDGNVYFLPDFGNWIGRLTPDGLVSRILLPLPASDNTFAAWAGLSESGGSIWASELWGGLWRLDPFTGTLKNYERIGQSKDYKYDWWNGMVTADGSVWLEVVDDRGFLDNSITAIGHLDPQTQTLTTYPVQQQPSEGYGPLVQATDGKLWIITAQHDASEPITTSIGVKHFDPKTDTITTFTIAPTFPKAESTLFPFPLPDVTYPPAVMAGPPVADSPMLTPASDGGIWVLCEGYSPDGFISYLVHISPTGAQMVSLAPDGGSVVAFAPGAKNTFWVIYYDPTVSPHYVLGQLNASGAITPIGRLTDSQPNYLTVGPDQHLWITTSYSNIIERVDLPTH